MMAGAAKLSVTIPAKQAASIRKAVKSGAFASDSEAVTEAIRVWEEQIEYLRRAWKEGIESGPSRPWDLKEFLAEAHARKARMGNGKAKRTKP
jgi:antitoxin ParD1/3/4